MPKRIHLIVGILSPLLIATFFTATILVEPLGSHAAVAQLKALIFTPGLWVFLPCLAATRGSNHWASAGIFDTRYYVVDGAAVSSPSDLSFGQRGEPTFHLIEPRG